MNTIRKKWGYIRETREMAQQAAKKYPESKFTGFEDYLEVLYPGRVWAHDKPFGKHGGISYRIRPDYLCEEIKLIIEFDGLQHYTSPANILKDKKNQEIYESFGYKVIRIPYFIQITNEVAKEMFGKNIDEQLFDPKLPSMGKDWGNTPAYCCFAGIIRMAEEFKRYPQQYKVNILNLHRDNDEFTTGCRLLEAAYNGKVIMPNNEFVRG